ncbi:MAG: DNA mismatch repair endonuclease MutL [Gammaproteobacteria bacterium]|nr:DNA mismatch repair endonuclease MutL [Gammaproteobacteria bacterium]
MAAREIMSGAEARIRQLPPQLANQIAAGEVIERPASVVKELLENSLDAAARRLELHIEAGGSRLIRICDDGQGIHAEDLPLALERHATSKLRDPADLARIATLGFRGEALPSIAAVARLRLCSRRAGGEHGAEIRAAAGEVETVRPAAHPRGTTVEVRDLFFNVPARRRFLRTDRTEFLHVQEVVRQLGLSCNETEIRMRHNGEEVLRMVPGTLERRVESLLGRPFLRQARRLGLQAGAMRLHGWFGNPGQARSQADRQYFFLNGRGIRDRRIGHALRAACQDLLPRGRFPAYVLFLELDPESADINVHPSKREVRLRDARNVYDFVSVGLRRALTGRDAALFPARPPPVTPPPTQPEVRDALQAAWQPHAPPPLASPLSASAPPASPSLASPPSLPLSRLVAGRFLAVVGERDLLLVDLPPARRALLALLVERHGDRALPRQPLLLPSRRAVAAAAAGALRKRRGELLELGLELDFEADGTVLLRSLPVLLAGADADRLLAALAESLPEPPVAQEDCRTVLRQWLIEWGAGALPDSADLTRQLLALLPDPKLAGSWRRLDVGQLASLLANAD